MTDERAMQIINNVAEEWVDLGETDFATKNELCDAILWLRKKDQEQIQDYIAALSSIILEAGKALRRK